MGLEHPVNPSKYQQTNLPHPSAWILFLSRTFGAAMGSEIAKTSKETYLRFWGTFQIIITSIENIVTKVCIE